MPTFKQELLDATLRRLQAKDLPTIAQEVLELRYQRALLEEEVEWLDRLADALRDDEDTTHITKEHREDQRNIEQFYLEKS